MNKLLRFSVPVLFSILAFGSSASLAFASSDVIINEFVSQPSSGNDWVELYNASTSPIDLTGWTLKDLAGTPHSTTTTMTADGFLVFSVGSNLNGSGDVIYLLDNTNATSSAVAYGSAATTTVDYEYAPTPASGESAYRTTDGGATWAVTANPTRGATNVIPSQIDVTSGNIADLTNALSIVAQDGIVTLSGNYTGDITISRPLTLKTATGATPTLSGSITITSDNVTVDGLDITNPSGSFGIVATDHSNLHITNNTIHDVGTTLTESSAQAIAVVSNAANVSTIAIEGNTISNIGNTSMVHAGSAGSSAKGVYLGNSTGSNTISDVIVSGNTINNIYASTADWIGSGGGYHGGAGAYGLLVNHKTTGLQVSNNTIGTLEGLWAHAIGLEADTPNAVVSNNIVTGLTDHKGGTDAMALRLEDNPSAPTVSGTGNTLDGISLVVGTSSVIVDSSIPVITGTTYPEILLNGSYHYIGANATSTIQGGVSLVASGGTVKVSAGTYVENVNITRGLTLQSASGAADTTISGTTGNVVTISADDVTVDGFTVTNGNVSGTGIYSSDHSNLTIKNNVVTAIGNGSDDIVGRGITIVSSSLLVDNVKITGNHIDGITSGKNTGIVSGGTSASGISVGWFKSGTQNVTNLVIQDNVINDISANTSVYPEGQGAYGLLINHGKSGWGQTVAPQILNNQITNLNGLWAHAIGLEGDTPSAVVTGNTINNLSSTKTPSDAVAVQVEDNPSANTIILHKNSFGGASVSWGVSDAVNGSVVSADQNYWGASIDPTTKWTPDGSTGTVTVSPWYTNAAMTTLTTGTPTPLGDEASTTVPVAVTQTGSDDGVTVTAEIPAGTVITGNASWDGTISAPTATTTTVTVSGYDTTVTSAIVVGSNDSDLTFDKAVKLTFTGQAGKRVGFYNHAGTFSEIMDTCAANDQTTGDALAEGTACKIDASSDLVVWTKHFSTFTTYSSSIATPIISPNGAVFHGFVNVTMDDSTAPAGIRYSIDGTDPVCGGNMGYTNGQVLTFTTSTTLKAIRCDGSSNSAIASATFSPAAGGGGGGSVSVAPAIPATPATPTVAPATPATPVTPAQGQVLGAEVYNFTKALAAGSRGDEVTELQKTLIAEGVLKINAPTGYFGKLTRAAVIAFQKSRGIAQAGVVGPLTRAELNKGRVVSAVAKTNLTTDQANAIFGLIESFGADASVVANVKASLGL